MRKKKKRRAARSTNSVDRVQGGMMGGGCFSALRGHAETAALSPNSEEETDRSLNVFEEKATAIKKEIETV